MKMITIQNTAVMAQMRWHHMPAKSKQTLFIKFMENYTKKHSFVVNDKNGIRAMVVIFQQKIIRYLILWQLVNFALFNWRCAPQYACQGGLSMVMYVR